MLKATEPILKVKNIGYIGYSVNKIVSIVYNFWIFLYHIIKI